MQYKITISAVMKLIFLLLLISLFFNGFTTFILSEDFSQITRLVYFSILPVSIAFSVLFIAKNRSFFKTLTPFQKIGIPLVLLIFIYLVPAQVLLHTAPCIFTLANHELGSKIISVDDVHRATRLRFRPCQYGLDLESQPVLGSKICVDYATYKIVEEALAVKTGGTCEILVTGKSSIFGMIPDQIDLVHPHIQKPCYVP